ESPAELQPLPNELERLVDHGFVDLALQRALYLAGEQPAPFGLGPVIEELRAILSQRDLGEFYPLLERRVADARKLTPPPPEQGPREWPARAPWRWADAGATAEAAGRWLQEAEEAQGLIRRHAILRAVLGLRDRPDAARELLRRAGAGGLAS